MIDLLPGASATSAALQAERVRMDIVAQNIANVHTTRGLDGKPYQRQQVVFETVLQQQQGSLGAMGEQMQSVRVARIEADQGPPRLMHNPEHPDADADGWVAMPNIDIHKEMVDMIAATRAFEANLAVIKNSRSMAMQTLGIGKR